jgi:protein involved in polysaccharide export with SLBB domain
MQNVLRTVCVLLAAGASLGCHVTHPHHHAAKHAEHVPPPADMPRELQKVVLPQYVIQPPDILIVEAVHIVPRSPYLLRTGDLISVFVPEGQTQPDSPIAGNYPVQPGGAVNLGLPYGGVKVSGLTIEEAQRTIQNYLLQNHLNEANVSVSLVEFSGLQQIAGQHMVISDGTITLGSYGSVPVVGLTLPEAKQVIEHHLGRFLEDPEVAVDVYAFNSLVYYVISEGAGTGDDVARFPITGNETVLDAIANINGLTQVSSKRIWIARPVPHSDQVQVLPVDWRAITATGEASSNYQILPGDRVFVAEDKLVAFDTNLAKLLAPAERAMGFTLLTVGTATRLSGKVLRGGGNPGQGGF